MLFFFKKKKAMSKCFSMVCLIYSRSENRFFHPFFFLIQYQKPKFYQNRVLRFESLHHSFLYRTPRHSGLFLLIQMFVVILRFRRNHDYPQSAQFLNDRFIALVVFLFEFGSQAREVGREGTGLFSKKKENGSDLIASLITVAQKDKSRGQKFVTTSDNLCKKTYPFLIKIMCNNVFCVGIHRIFMCEPFIIYEFL